MIFGEDGSCHNDIVSVFHEFADETSLRNALSGLHPRSISETSETTAIVGVPEGTKLEEFIGLLENIHGIIIAEKVPVRYLML